MPVGFPVVPGWYSFRVFNNSILPMLPGGMIAAGGGAFVMATVGWIFFGGKLPL